MNNVLYVVEIKKNTSEDRIRNFIKREKSTIGHAVQVERETVAYEHLKYVVCCV